MLGFKAETLEMMVRGEPLATVADHICRHIEKCFSGVVSSILTVDRGGLLHPLSAPSLPETYLAALDNVAAGPNVGSCGAAAYSGQSVEARDISVDPRWETYRELTLSLGLKACWSTPLADASGYVIATIALYFRDCRGPSESERELIDLCKHLWALATSRQSRVDDRERRATRDALTGLPNRGSFETTLTRLNCAEPGGWGLFIIDLDNLKTTNDTFGHAAGDVLLQEVAARLANWAAPDRAFRIGGDEFAILVMAPERLNDSDKAATEILTHLLPPIELEAFTLTPMATIGSALVSGSESDPGIVFRNADTALYHAKETQPGRHVQFHSLLETRIAARLSSIETVEVALQEERIHAWYQPIVDLRSERVVGFEALCRMMTAEGEVIPASVFSEATADPRAASALTHRMLSHVARDMLAWRALGIPLLPIGVNVTAVDLRGGRLVQAIDTIFDQDADLIRSLVLEINERAYIGNLPHLLAEGVHSLRSRGIRIGLDDFGAGMASLTHLRNLPIDAIKIDKSLVERLPGDDLSATIISSVVAIANNLGARVIAEGVEAEDQLILLASLGCSACQGYIYSPAVPRSKAFLLAMRHSALQDLAMPFMRRSVPVMTEPDTEIKHRADATRG